MECRKWIKALNLKARSNMNDLLIEACLQRRMRVADSEARSEAVACADVGDFVSWKRTALNNTLIPSFSTTHVST